MAEALIVQYLDEFGYESGHASASSSMGDLVTRSAVRVTVSGESQRHGKTNLDLNLEPEIVQCSV